MMALFFTGYNDDDDNIVEPSLTGQTKTYTFNSMSNPDISGTVKFAERSDNSTLVTINLNGITSGPVVGFYHFCNKHQLGITLCTPVIFSRTWRLRMC